MKPEEVLKQIQKMYRSKTFELDQEKENIFEYQWHFSERNGHYFSDDTYGVGNKDRTHFCTIEFAKRLLAKPTIQRARKIMQRTKSRLKIFGKPLTP